eukprot:GFYU01013100.1.p2 GENE.GFYU01013100.1~~GFYU01013100.1.p2  ORF type:complete len:109 (+),score=22.98 GFYU01013100.1:49-375(+)
MSQAPDTARDSLRDSVDDDDVDEPKSRFGTVIPSELDLYKKEKERRKNSEFELKRRAREDKDIARIVDRNRRRMMDSGLFREIHRPNVALTDIPRRESAFTPFQTYRP